MTDLTRLETVAAEPETAWSCVPKNTTIKYEDVYGGIPVNLGINVAVWLVSCYRCNSFIVDLRRKFTVRNTV